MGFGLCRIVVGKKRVVVCVVVRIRMVSGTRNTCRPFLLAA